jgi:hypothetical protein
MSDTQLKKVESAESRARAKVKKSYEKIQKDTTNLIELKDKIGIKQGCLVGGWCSS